MILTILLSLALDTCKTPISGAKLVPRTSEHKNHIIKGKMYFTGVGWSDRQDKALFLTDSCMLKSAYKNYTRWVSNTLK